MFVRTFLQAIVLVVIAAVAATATASAQAPERPGVLLLAHGGQPQKRETLTIDRVTGDIAKAETFADLSAGRRARSWLRFAHTGEFYGLAGQTMAGIVSAGGIVMVYTGLALACRRFFSWIRRRRLPAAEVPKAA